jgi:hypothetical protein
MCPSQYSPGVNAVKKGTIIGRTPDITWLPKDMVPALELNVCPLVDVDVNEPLDDEPKEPVVAAAEPMLEIKLITPLVVHLTEAELAFVELLTVAYIFI